MAAPVVVKFQVEGVAQIQHAFRTVEAACIQAEQKKVSAFKGTSDERIAFEKRAERELIRSLTLQHDAFVKAEKDKAKAVKDAASQRVAEEKKGQSQLDAIRNQAHAKYLSDAKNRVAEEKKGQAQLDAIRNKAHSDFLADQKSRADAVTASLRRQENEAHASRRRFAQAIGTVAHAGIGGLSQGIRTVAGIGVNMLGQAMQLGGGFSVAGAVQQRMSLDRRVEQIANSSYVPDAKDGRQNRMTAAEKAAMSTKFRASAIANGISTDDLSEGIEEYIRLSSDPKGGMANMDFMAKVAKGQGAKFADVAKAMGMLTAQNEGLKDHPEQANQLLLNVIAQGRHGAIELPDIARVASKITKTSSMYSMDQTEAQRQLLGLAQIGIKTSGSPSEAATSISNFSSDSMKHAKAIGLKTDAQDRISGDVADVFRDVFKNAHGSLRKMMLSEKDGGFGYTQRSFKMLEAVAPEYKKAFDAAGGGEKGNIAGSNAVWDKIKESTASKYTEGQMSEDFANVMSTQAERTDTAMRKLNDALSAALVPQIERFIPILEKMIPVFASLAENAVPAFLDALKTITDFLNANKGIIADLAAHPISTIITAYFASATAKAALAEGVKHLLTPGAGPGGGIGGVGGVGGGIGGGAAPGRAMPSPAAGGAVMAGMALQGAWLMHQYNKTDDDAADKATGIRARIESMVSKGDIAGARKLMGEQQATSETSTAFDSLLNVANYGAAAMTGPLGYAAKEIGDNLPGSSSNMISDKIAANDIVNSADLRRLIADAVVGGVKDGVAASPGIADPDASMRVGRHNGTTGVAP